MVFLDWVIATAPLFLVLGVGAYCQRYVRGVADFLSGGRMADRYLLAIAGGELQAGAVVFVALFEVIRRSGFALSWWGWLSTPVALVISISGFVIYRFRETRALTLAQFFELRYSKSFRLFTGFLGFIAGILNFGIIPAVGARCLTYFLDFPTQVPLFSVPVPTYLLLMAIFLSVALFIGLTGGLVSIIVINCLEGIVAQLAYLLIIVALLSVFSWSKIVTVLQERPLGQSLLNPFDSSGVKDFNLWYVLMSLAVGTYGTMAWQNAGGYQAAAFTPHESRMGGILGRWREMGKGAVITLLGICALTFLGHPDFAAQVAPVQAQIAGIPDAHVQSQMLMPVAIVHLLPMGIKGLLCAVFLMGIFGGDATHLHSWGSIFVQDVLVPLRKKSFGTRQHLLALRCSMVGVAFFAFLFGALYRQTDYVVMWFAITTAIYVGGAGAAIIGGLYWKKGTTQGAWTALFTGSTLSVAGILARQIDPDFPLNGIEVYFGATILASLSYVGVSLLTCKEDFNMDRMLYRGEYAVVWAKQNETLATSKRKAWLGRLIGIDENFTLGDKWIAGALFGWGGLLCGIFLVGTAWNWIAPWPAWVWAAFWHVIAIGLPVLFAVVTGIWFTWGGVRDLRALFARLKQEKVNPRDDGSVADHRNADELC